ncbi:hypothetical protein RchiOBHm_Chr5g0042681 [Rosa chinensis]|uniref:Uncharacterized protein n=1 Tax=Rosa chinensis TaxID=74649 RepID=A0A2P6QD48_ROSCH|nr:hypothetical protein RchiOBHm_Chr5g0042681 [Rosa chinensis]
MKIAFIKTKASIFIQDELGLHNPNPQQNFYSLPINIYIINSINFIQTKEEKV